MNFLDLLYTPKKTLKIFDDVILEEGDIVNIYGEPYVGKTLSCYWIINNNPTKSVAYFDTEHSPYPVIEQMIKSIPIVYALNNDLEKIREMMKSLVDTCDYFIIDSFTASDFDQRKKVLLEICNIVKKKHKNLILVSQVREWDGKQFYEYKKFLDFSSYQARVTETDKGECVINEKYKVSKEFLGTYHP